MIHIQVQILSVGKIKEKHWALAIEEYKKRLTPYAKVQVIEVSDEKAPENLSAIEAQQVKDKEGARLLALVKQDTYVIALNIQGKQLSSEQLATRIEELGINGHSHLTFIIGGSLGLSDDVEERADLNLSFGSMTFPHQLMRVILLEQIYRSFKIIRGEPYHK